MILAFLSSLVFILVDVPFLVSNRYLGRLVAMFSLIICVIVMTRTTRNEDNF